MLGCVQHSYLFCGGPIRYSGKQLHSNEYSGLLGMRPLQNSGMWHPLLKQGNHYRRGVEKNIFKREKTLFSGYPFSCLSGVKNDSGMPQQSDARVIDFVSPEVGNSQATASSISCNLPPTGFGHYPIPKRRMGVPAFGNVAARRTQRHVCFATISQLIRHGRAKKKHKAQSRALSNCPQKQGICLEVGKRNPRKPNSGDRKTARVRLSTGRDVTCLIPGEGHNLEKNSVVLVGGGAVKDLSGVNYRIIRGTRDLKGVPDRKRGRSQYGTKKPRKKPEKKSAI